MHTTMFSLLYQQSLEQNKPTLIISGCCKTDASVSAEPCSGSAMTTAPGNPVIPPFPRGPFEQQDWFCSVKRHSCTSSSQHYGTPEMLLQLKPSSIRKRHVKKLLIVWKSGINTRVLILWARARERKEYPFGKQTEAVPGLCCFCKINTQFSIHEVTNCHLIFLIKPLENIEKLYYSATGKSPSSMCLVWLGFRQFKPVRWSDNAFGQALLIQEHRPSHYHAQFWNTVYQG